MSEVKWSDVAHLYLGCELMMDTSKWFNPEGLKKVILRGIMDMGEYFHYQYDKPNENTTGNWTHDNFKPILRPLSDITDEEEREIHSLEKSFEDKPHLNIELWAAMTTKYRQLGFDIDGLISSGQAISKNDKG